MNEFKQLSPKEGVTILAVKVPEGVKPNTVENGDILIVNQDHRPEYDDYILLPPGNWTPLGIDTELTEEQCLGLVEGDMEHLHGFECEAMVYPDFTDETGCYFTAKESFESIMYANDLTIGTWLILKRLS